MKKHPIDKTIVQKRAQIRKMLVEISYNDEQLAIQLLRQWVEEQVPVTKMYEVLKSHLREKQAI
ncbi:hypothetical protein ACE1TI_13340 [Alteribacillus sp. JSM 102045]|uniref:hypothetical protein n=1 Tax=Alteribacillus sp. JSM 102045 TaxID=1562101 RepID=UPI0035BEC06E